MKSITAFAASRLRVGRLFEAEATIRAHHRGTEAQREQIFAGPGDDGPAKARPKGRLPGARFFLLPVPRFLLLFRAVFHVPPGHPETMKSITAFAASRLRVGRLFEAEFIVHPGRGRYSMSRFHIAPTFTRCIRPAHGTWAGLKWRVQGGHRPALLGSLLSILNQQYWGDVGG
jgi:hypothetical protein